jgi:hypothetical protein
MRALGAHGGTSENKHQGHQCKKRPNTRRKGDICQEQRRATVLMGDMRSAAP